MAPRTPVPLREIVYTLSPYNQEIVMQGVAKLPGKIAKFFKNVSSLCRITAMGTPGGTPTCHQPYCSAAAVLLQNASGLAIFNAVLFGPIL